MFKFLIRRFGMLIVTLFGISIVVFALVRIIPGDAIDVKLGTEVAAISEEQMAELRAYFGLDKPVAIQYWNWLKSTLQGNLGYSIRTGRPVLSELLDRFPVTLELAIFGIILGVLIGIPAGIISALKPDTIWDWSARVGALLGLSFPRFWLGTLLILVFSLYFRWLPTSGGYVDFFEDPIMNLKQLFLPAFCLSISLAAAVMRTARSAMLEVKGEDYIRTAYGKGLSPNRVLWNHALKNALIPIITIVGIQAGYLLGGTVVIEQIFALPGVGRLTLHAIYQRDYAMIQGAVIFIAMNFVLINLVVDITYAIIDPRIRLD